MIKKGVLHDPLATNADTDKRNVILDGEQDSGSASETQHDADVDSSSATFSAPTIHVPSVLGGQHLRLSAHDHVRRHGSRRGRSSGRIDHEGCREIGTFGRQHCPDQTFSAGAYSGTPQVVSAGHPASQRSTERFWYRVHR